MPIKLFSDGEILDADDVNTYFMGQAVVIFNDEADRDAAFGGSGEPALSEGRICYLKSDQTIYFYDGTSWVGQLFLIADDSVTTQKILNDAVTQDKIADDAVGTNQIASSVTLTTPDIGVATATSLNGLSITSSTGTLTVSNGKTLTASNTITLSGTDSSTISVSGNVTIGSSTHTVALTTTGNTSLALPTSGTLVSTASSAVITDGMLNYSSVKNQTVSTSNPSGGKQHDIWIKVSA